jgi:hypothetical protein
VGSQYVDFGDIEARLTDALQREFPGEQVAVIYDGMRSPRLIRATVAGVSAEQETWFIEESFSTMVFELAGKLREALERAALSGAAGTA